jgi:hypothetical protein
MKKTRSRKSRATVPLSTYPIRGFLLVVNAQAHLTLVFFLFVVNTQAHLSSMSFYWLSALSSFEFVQCRLTFVDTALTNFQ